MKYGAPQRMCADKDFNCFVSVNTTRCADSLISITATEVSFAGGRTLKLDAALNYAHLSTSETFGSRTVQFRGKKPFYSSFFPVCFTCGFSNKPMS